MKKIRCTLLCFTLLSVVCMTAGCRNNRNNGTTSPAPSSSSAGAVNESTSAMQTTSGAADHTQTTSSASDRNNAEGTSLHETGGVMEDLGDLGSDIGRDVTNAMDDLTGTHSSTEVR